MLRAHEEVDHHLCPTCGQGLPDEKWLIFDPVKSQILIGDDLVRLTPSEYAIVRHLKDVHGRIVTKTYLYDMLYAYRGEADDRDLRTVDVFLSHIRTKLAGTRLILETVWGHGVCLRVKGESR